MKKYMYGAITYSDSTDPFSKQGYAQIDQCLGDLEGGVKQTEKIAARNATVC